MRTIILIALSLIYASGISQEVNWRSLEREQKHLVNLNMGLDYAATIGLGYSYKLNSRLPVILNGEISLPFGETLLDDFKSKLGAQVEVIEVGKFSTSLNAYAVFRRFENPNTRLLNFGSEFSLVTGYYQPKWFVAGKFGFDKAIITQIKNRGALSEYYPDARDGWYIPTGGNFFYGIQSGYSFKDNSVTLIIGKYSSEDFNSGPLMPYVLKIGYYRVF